MKKILLIIPIVLLLFTITSCNEQTHNESNDYFYYEKDYKYIYIPSEKKFIEIEGYNLAYYNRTIKIKTKDKKYICISNGNWILTQEATL